MSDSPREDLAELTRALLTHLAWQRDLGVLELSREGSLPRVTPSPAPSETPAPQGTSASPQPAPHPSVAPPPQPTPVAAQPVAPAPQPVAPQPAPVAPAPQPSTPPLQVPALGFRPGAPVPPAIAMAAAPPKPPVAPVAPVARALFDEPAAPTRTRGPALEGQARLDALRVIQDEVVACASCRLVQKRTQTVFARGNPFARLCFIGEGPGEQEDRTGSPFVGPAGQLLDKIIGAMGLQPDEVYVCNVVKCRPPNNRTPEPDEMHACSPFLVRQLELVRPEVIVALGRTAVSFLLNSKDSMTRLRGRWHTYEGIPVLPTWHPAYLLRTPEAKADTWADMKLVMARLGLTPPSRG